MFAKEIRETEGTYKIQDVWLKFWSDLQINEVQADPWILEFLNLKMPKKLCKSSGVQKFEKNEMGQDKHIKRYKFKILIYSIKKV